MIGSKVDELIYLLRKQRKLRIERIFIGGGGNAEGNCRMMTLEWIKSFVLDLLEGRPERTFTADMWEELRP